MGLNVQIISSESLSRFGTFCAVEKQVGRPQNLLTKMLAVTFKDSTEGC